MKTTRALILLSLGLLISQNSFGQFAEDALRFSQFGLGVGARNLGMGNAAVGSVSDYSSLFWNPAGLALQRNYEVSIGLTQQGFANDATFLGSTTNASKNATNLNNIGFVYPVATSRGSLTFAFGYGRTSDYNGMASFGGFNSGSSIVASLAPVTNLNGFSSNERASFLNNNIPFQIFLADTANSGGYLYPVVTDSVQQTGTVTEGGGVNHWSLGGAMDIAPNLSVGVSLNFVSGSYSYDRVYVELDSRNVYHYAPPFDFDKFTFQSSIASDISGFNALIGLMYRKQGVYKVGVTVRTPTNYEINETFTDNGKSWFKNGDYFQHQLENRTTYRIETPIVLSAGASVQLLDFIMLAGDAEYTDWTQMKFDSNNADLVDENRVIAKIFRATTNLRGGAEVTLFDLGVKLRGGIVWNPSPYKNDPADYDQLYYTAGIGVQLDNQVTLNVGYALGTWKTFRDNYYIPTISEASTTREKIKTNSINATLSLQF